LRSRAIFLYWNERYAEGTVGDDHGASIADSVLTLNVYGAPPEELWPYDIKKFKEKPPESVYAAAKKNVAVSYYRLPSKTDALLALHNGWVVNIGMTVYASMMNVGADGVLPMPTKDDKKDGGHAVCVVGYEMDKHVVVMNSWGTSWADGGFFYMPWAYFFSENVMDDMYIVTSVTEGTPKG